MEVSREILNWTLTQRCGRDFGQKSPTDPYLAHGGATWWWNQAIFVIAVATPFVNVST